jgi:hypothetical protein
MALKFVSVVRLQFRSGEDNCWFGLARREDDPEDPVALKFVSVVRLQFRSGEDNCWFGLARRRMIPRIQWRSSLCLW